MASNQKKETNKITKKETVEKEKTTVKKTTPKKATTTKKKTSTSTKNSPKKTSVKKETPKKDVVVEKEETKVIEPEKVTTDKKVEVIEPPKEEAKKETPVKAQNNFGSFESIIILILVALFACVAVYIVNDKLNNKEENKYATASKEIQTFIDQYNNILENYYGDVDKNELIENAIKGMLESLDGYSQFIDDGSNSFAITLEGSYEGVGIEIANDSEGNIIVMKVYDDTPASKAGIQAGDYIIKFNDEKLENVKTSVLVDKIAGVSKMKLTLLRNNEEVEVQAAREKITLKSVNYEMLENKIGYIQISIFANNTYEQFKKALETLEQQGMEKLILDVRSNSGGHLEAVKDMLSLFMDKSHVIYQTESKTETVKVHSTGKVDKTYPIVILQNSASASASEILSSSLKEQLNAYIVGTTSFGKGTVQQLQTVSGIGQYKFTTKKWLTSKGVWINQAGVKADLEVQMQEEYFKNPTRENDNQFQSALEHLK